MELLLVQFIGRYQHEMNYTQIMMRYFSYYKLIYQQCTIAVQSMKEDKKIKAGIYLHELICTTV